MFPRLPTIFGADGYYNPYWSMSCVFSLKNNNLFLPNLGKIFLDMKKHSENHVGVLYYCVGLFYPSQTWVYSLVKLSL